MSELVNYEKGTKLRLPWQVLSLICAFVYLFSMVLLNQVPLDVGDGLEHYAISRQSWFDSDFFLHHWGKPLFVLFSSPFAQFGYQSYVVFNLVVFAATCLVASSIFKHYEVSASIGSVFPWILLAVPDYSKCVLGGLTEPFFSLLVLLAFFCLIKEKWLFFAVLAGAAPFARSEGMLVVVLAICLLIWHKKPGYVICLLVPFTMYSLVGEWLISKPWWYFQDNPYTNSLIYGKGEWYSYLRNSMDHFGLVTFFIATCAVIFGCWNSRKWVRNFLVSIGFLLAIHLGIIFIHAYFWTFGLRSSLGLSRIATQGLPGTIVVLLLIIGLSAKFIDEQKLGTKFLRFVFYGLLTYRLIQLPYPVQKQPFEDTIFQASEFVKKHQGKMKHLFYFHPLVAYDWNTNTKAPNDFLKHHYGHLLYDIDSTFQEGDYILRDSQFGAFEQGLSLDSLKMFPWIVPVKHFYANDIYPHTNGEYKSVILYRVMDRNSFDAKGFWRRFAQRALKVKGNETLVTIKSGEEFGMINEQFNVPELPSRQKLLCFKLKSEKPIEGTVFLVFDDGNGYYCRKDITTVTEGDMALLIGKATGKLYIHNPTFQPLKVTFSTTSWKYQEEPGIASF